MTLHTTVSRKFLPEGVPAWQMPFWESLKAHAIKVQRCDHCGTFRYTPREICSRCYGDMATWTPITGRGVLYTYTVVRRAPTPAYEQEAPYVLAHVTMNEDFRMIARLLNVVPGEVRIGMPVEVIYEEASPDWTLFNFQPA